MIEKPQTSPSPATDSPSPDAARHTARRSARRKRLQEQRAVLTAEAPNEAPPKIAGLMSKLEAPAAPFKAPSAKPQAPIAKATLPAPRITSSARAPQIAASKPRRRLLWATLGVLGCCIAAISGAVGTYLSWRGGGQILPNTFVASEPVGGLTRHQALERVRGQYGNLHLTIKAPVEDYELSLRELGGSVDINRAVNNAYWMGRSGSIWKNLPRVLTARYEPRSLKLPVRWDKAKLKTRMRAVARKFNEPARDAKLKVDGSGVHIVPDEPGRALNVGETLARLQRSYKVGQSSFEATVRDVKPRLAAADLEGSDVKLEQYTTRFNRGLVGRTCNIRVAAAAVNGRVLLPGQTFSFNASTGERTAAKGYRMAHIFERKPGAEESEVVDGLAGGTCQVSSTLFNAIRKSNRKVDSKLKIVQRETHSLPVTYVPAGLDATVAWPNRDFKFRNTLPNPIYLRTAVNGSRLTVSVWARVPSQGAGGLGLEAGKRFAGNQPPASVR